MRRLGRETAIYGLGRLVNVGVGFLMVPFYTRIFMPWEYGVIEAINVLAMLVGTLIGMGTHSALAYYLSPEDRDGARRVATVVLQWRLAWGSVVALAAMMAGPWLTMALFDIPLAWEVGVAAFAGVLAGQLVTFSSLLFQLLRRPWAYITVGVTAAVTGAGLNLIFVALLGWGVAGYFAGLLLGQVVALVAVTPRLGSVLEPGRWHANLWPRLLRFGVPLVPAMLASYLLNFADRWFIMHFLAADSLGLYGLAFKGALLVQIVVTVVGTAFLPHALHLIKSPDEAAAERELATLMRYYGGVFLSWALVVAAAAPLAVRILAPPAYAEAAGVVGALTLPPVLYGMTQFSSLGMWRAERTALYSISVGIAVVVNLALNALLIPLWGIVGAAIATAAAMTTLVTASFIFSQRMWPLRLGFATAVAQLAVAAVALVVLHRVRAAEMGAGADVAVVTVAIAVLAGLTVRRGDRAGGHRAR